MWRLAACVPTAGRACRDGTQDSCNPRVDVFLGCDDHDAATRSSTKNGDILRVLMTDDHNQRCAAAAAAAASLAGQPALLQHHGGPPRRAA
jgi:hypothetical protein